MGHANLFHCAGATAGLAGALFTAACASYAPPAAIPRTTNLTTPSALSTIAGPAPRPATQKNWFDLQVGDCLGAVPQVDLGEVTVPVVDCTTAHRAEVYLRGRGWVRVDPTAAAAPGRIDGGLARSMGNVGSLPFLMRPEFEWLRGLRSQWEAVAHKWNVWVLGYNPDRQRDLLSFVGIPDADWRALTATLFVILGVMTAGLLAWSLRRFARPDPVQAAWRAFCRKLAAGGLERAAHEGPRDFSIRAARALPALRRSILRIAALYISLRYGAQASAERITELRRRVRELRIA